MKFKVDRSRWVNGSNRISRGESLLLNRQGNMCCLGFCMLQLGAKDAQIKNAITPASIFRLDIPEKITEKIKSEGFIEYKIRAKNSELAIDAVEINDSSDLDKNEREEALAKLFKKHGHEIEFYDTI